VIFKDEKRLEMMFYDEKQGDKIFEGSQYLTWNPKFGNEKCTMKIHVPGYLPGE
jgi:hypothetical protein